MAGQTPEITLELAGGSLTIKTAQAIYRIVVTAAAGSSEDEPDAEYYRDLRHDMYREVGRLA